jgi:hypothetical protein
VAFVNRRLFEEQNLFPEPPDEKPLIMVEEKVKEVLEPDVFEAVKRDAADESVSTLIAKYL